MPDAENDVARRLDQIERTAHRVRPTDRGKWSLAAGRPSPADSVLIAPADFAWLIEVARAPGYGPTDTPEKSLDFTSRRLGSATDDPWTEGWNRALEVCQDDLRAALAGRGGCLKGAIHD